MKRPNLLIILLVTTLFSFTLTGCCLKHEWKEATCTEPKTCVKCGATEGEVLDHTWTEATCQAPKTCSVCGATEGDVAPHTWVEASFAAPKTCSVCGQTEGEAYKFEIIDFSFLGDDIATARVCADCVLAKKNGPDDKVDLVVYDFDGNQQAEFSVDLPEYSWSYFMGVNPKYSLALVTEEGICVYDYDGALVSEDYDFDYLNEYFYFDYPRIYATFNDDVIELAYSDGETIFFYDIANHKVSDVRPAEDEDPYADENWYYCNKQKVGDFYMVGSKDQTEWGYLDKDKNVIQMYADATDFNADGYALVSEDRVSYDLIDADFNVVLEDAVRGDGASTATFDYWFKVTNGEDYAYFRVIK